MSTRAKAASGFSPRRLYPIGRARPAALSSLDSDGRLALISGDVDLGSPRRVRRRAFRLQRRRASPMSSRPCARFSAGDPDLRRRVAFSVAMIALSAKMAKADGIVTQDEMRAFQEIFAVPPEETRNVARLYDLAKRDVAGFETYAERMAQLCGSGKANCAMLEDILDGLFHIAKADGLMHEREGRFLHRIAEIFRIERGALPEHPGAARRSRRRPIPMSCSASSAASPSRRCSKHYRKLVADNHPDRLIARGLPEEFIEIATTRLAAINARLRDDRAGAAGPHERLCARPAGRRGQGFAEFRPAPRRRSARHDRPALYRHGDGQRRRGLAVRSGERGVVALSRPRGRPHRADGARERPRLACRQKFLARRDRHQFAARSASRSSIPAIRSAIATFRQRQIEAVIELCRGIIGAPRDSGRNGCLPIPTWRRAARSIPARSFPWRQLVAAGVGHFVAPAPRRRGAVLEAGRQRRRAVEELQSMLALYGYGIEITGVFDRPDRTSWSTRSSAISGRAWSTAWPTARRSGRCGGCLRRCPPGQPRLNVLLEAS